MDLHQSVRNVLLHILDFTVADMGPENCTVFSTTKTTTTKTIVPKTTTVPTAAATTAWQPTPSSGTPPPVSSVRQY